MDFPKYKDYLKAKNHANSVVCKHYEQEEYRTMRWHAKINRRRSEDRMVNNFEKVFGRPDDVILAFGDWEQRQQMKYKEPTLGKGVRKIFRQRGYQDQFLVWEFRTSCRCYNCAGESVSGSDGSECVKFLYVDNPKPPKKKKKKKPKGGGLEEEEEEEKEEEEKEEKDRRRILRHGLLKCNTCSKIWNRDMNGALNIGRIAIAILAGQDRPAYLCRAKKAGDHEPVQPPKKKRRIEETAD